MIKDLSLLFGIVLIVCYLAFAFANWDISWAAHVDTVMRASFMTLYVFLCLICIPIYFEIKNKF